MAQSNYAEIADAASAASIPRGATTSAVVPMPSGGGNFVFAAHSIDTSPGAVALYHSGSSFVPTPKAGDITGAVRKGGAGGSGFSAYIFVNLGGPNSTDTAYILGLSNTEPAHLELRKGTLATGLPDMAPGGNSILRRSTQTFALGTWVHLRLEAVLEPTGDVLLNCYQSDLSAHPVTSPVWVAVPGMASFTDDFLQVNTQSAPLSTGRMGFGGTFAEINRIAAFDQIVPARQVSP